MKKPIYKYSFRKRTILYLIIGISCVSIDFLSFMQLSKFIDPLYSNPISYMIGSTCSYFLNKKYTFQSENSRLSIIRYSSIILVGLSASQLVIFVGLNLLNFKNYLAVIKWLAMLASVSLQYFGNTLYGSKTKND